MLSLLLACSGDRTPSATAAAATDSAPPAAQHIDSVVPREVAIERFREGTRQVTAFEGGASSRDALVKSWVKAIETADTTALQRMLINRDEFAWLYYPTASQGLPPYDLSPSLLWFMTEGQSTKGLRRLLQERAGKPMHMIGYTCDPKSTIEGREHRLGTLRAQAGARRVIRPGKALRVDRGARRRVEVPELQGAI